MARLTRAQQQERTRAAVLAAARDEFGEHGFAEAKVDRIADRAELTRGAVYSNFPGKRALYLAVLVAMVERASFGASPSRSPTESPPSSSPPPSLLSPLSPLSSPSSPAEALGAFARVWLERLPLAGDTPAGGHLRLRSLAGVVDDEPARTALAQVTRLEALLLALPLESYLPRGRRVRLAELVLTLLNGSVHLAENAPGFGDPFDVTRACEHLAGIDLADTWDPPHLAYAAPAKACWDTWSPPAGLLDLLSGRPADLGESGVIALLGTGRLEAAEEAVRTARAGDRVTVAVLTSDPAEIGRLIRLRIGDLTGCLRRVFAPDTWPHLQIVLDERAQTAQAAGLEEAADATEAAVRVRDGRITARAHGRGAVHAAGSRPSA